MRFLPMIFRKAIRKGRLHVTGPDGATEVFGGREPGPEVAIRINDASLDWRIALDPELKAAEAYMDGGLEIEGGAIRLLELFFLNKRNFDLSPGNIFFRGLDRRRKRLMQRNPIARSRRNVAHHYDLGNDFYRLWLDPDMQYSCGYFPTGEEDLEEAQLLKKRHIAAKLQLAPGQRVLDIGCGWGGMALYLAAVAGVEVHGVTLSEEQLAVARARAAAAGLADRVTFELIDYRNVEGRFERVVSVGMLEHVGAGHLMEYFLKVRDLLVPAQDGKHGGLALIHTISHNSPPGITGPFIRKYIFPGGYAPSLSEMAGTLEQTGLWMLDVEIWRVHYADTLKIWRENFEAKRAEVEAMHDARFARMWEFYLGASECAFRYGSSNVAQLQIGRDRDSAPLHRDYVARACATLAAREAEALPAIAAATAAAFARGRDGVSDGVSDGG